MQRHRKCEACERNALPLKPTHPYLKRKRKSSNIKTMVHEQHQKLNEVAETGFHYIDDFTANARAKYAALPELIPKAEMPADFVLTSEETYIDEGADIAQAWTDRHFEEAQAQLAAPRIAPKDLTHHEHAEKSTSFKWATNHEKKEREIEDKIVETYRTLQEVITACDEVGQTLSARQNTKDINLTPPSSGSSDKRYDNHSKALTRDSSRQAEREVEETGPNSAIALHPTDSDPSNPPQQLPQVRLHPPYQDYKGPVPHQTLKSTKTRTKNDPRVKTNGWHSIWAFGFSAKW